MGVNAPLPDACRDHGDAACQVCERYDWVIRWEHGTERGFFWVGQDAEMWWGVFGDGIQLTYRARTPENAEKGPKTG